MEVDGGIIGSSMTSYLGTDIPANTTFKTRDRITRLVDVYGIFQFDTAPVTAVLASLEQTDIV